MASSLFRPPFPVRHPSFLQSRIYPPHFSSPALYRCTTRSLSCSRFSQLGCRIKSQHQDAPVPQAVTHGKDIDKLEDDIRETVVQFLQTDIEEAVVKYDMEEELFAEVDYAQINAFTDQPFGGNPAAVCYLPLKREDRWMQLVARQFNLSETAFLIKRNATKRKSTALKKYSDNSINVSEFDLRWFTPKVEVDLCGHATLASAHLLFASGIAEGDVCIFHTRSGVLKARKIAGYNDDEMIENDDKSDIRKSRRRRPTGVGAIELDFPVATWTECDDPVEVEQVASALGRVQITWLGKTSLGDYLVEVSSRREVEQVQPQFSYMMNFSGRGGTIVTTRVEEDSELDFISRFFCPKSGILEDPVTGSAHCALGPFWAKRLGKTTLRGFQASERGGHVVVRVDENEGRVYLQGSAILVMAGVLLNTLRG